MKRKNMIYVGALMVAAIGSGSWLGCQHSRNPTGRPLNANEERTNETVWEYQTVEKVFSGDPEKGTEQLKQHMQEFQLEGWHVLSVSKPLPQADGSIRRTYEVRRAKK